MLVAHHPEDSSAAERITHLLKAAGIEAAPIPESMSADVLDPAGPVVLWLWTHAAHRRGISPGLAETPPARALLVRLDDAPLVEGMEPRGMIDLTRWDGAPEPEAAQELVRAIRTLVGTRLEPSDGLGKPQFTTGSKLDAAAEVQRLLEEINDPATEPPRRLQIGDELERLGDPRPGVGLDANGLPDIAWVKIPAGPFIYQEGERRELPAFSMARYPITNRQYHAFIDDGGYRDDRWWPGLERPQPEAPRWPQGNRPRTNVNWYEAVAFTRWLNARLGLCEGSIRLPTELEWDHAAQGKAYRSSDWTRQTSAAGLHPAGQSPYGVEDLSRDVWEWCLNAPGHPDDTFAETAARGLRAVRGEKLGRNAGGIAADGTYRTRPDPNMYRVGFRVLSSAPTSRKGHIN